MKHTRIAHILGCSLLTLLSACGSNDADEPTPPPEPQEFTFSAQFKSTTLCGSTDPYTQHSMLIYDSNWQKLSELSSDEQGNISFTSEYDTLNIMRIVDASPNTAPNNIFAILVENVTAKDHGTILISANTEQGCECETRPVQISVPDEFYRHDATISVTVGTNNTATFTYNGMPTEQLPEQKLCRQVNQDFTDTPVFITSEYTQTAPYEYKGVMARSIDFAASDTSWVVNADLPAALMTVTDLSQQQPAAINRNFYHWHNQQQLTPNLSVSDDQVLSFADVFNDQASQHALLTYNPSYSASLPGVNETVSTSSFYYQQTLSSNINSATQINMPAFEQVISYEQEMADFITQSANDFDYDLSASGYAFSHIQWYMQTSDHDVPSLRDSIRIHFYGNAKSTMPLASAILPALSHHSLDKVQNWNLSFGAFDITQTGAYSSAQSVFLTGSLMHSPVAHEGRTSTAYSLSSRQ